MTSKVSVVNWNVAPADAQFHSAYCFRKHEGFNEYFWDEEVLEWKRGWKETLEEHKRYSDFEMRPELDDSNCSTYNPDETPYDELEHSDDNVTVVSDHIAELAARTLKECSEGKSVREAAEHSAKAWAKLAAAAAEKSEWTATHYDNYYHLTEADIKSGKIKVDAYFVNKMWKLNEKDDTGALFHSLKTIARFGDKNPIERELKALYAQTKRMAELYGVDLEC